MYEVCVTFYMRVKQVITSFSKGYSQVLLQNNVVSGLFFFLATGIAFFNMGHPEILYFSAISAALSPFFAWYLRYPDEEINEGIWGYNAVLYGIACGMLRNCCTYCRNTGDAPFNGVQIILNLLARPVLVMPSLPVFFQCGIY